MFLQVWFDKDIFKGIDDDECLEDADVEAAITAIKKKGGKVLEKQSSAAAANGKAGKRLRLEESGDTSDEGDDDDDESDSDSDYDMEQMRKSAKSAGK